MRILKNVWASAIALSLAVVLVTGCNNQRVPPLEVGQPTYKNSIGMEFVFIEPGTFTMGSPEDEPLRDPMELPHEVEITRPFYIGKFEVTQEQYQKVMGSNPSYFQPGDDADTHVAELDTSNFPVDQVSWFDAVEFCERLNARERGAKFTYRLPTEAEWEYACRAGTTTAFNFGDSASGEDANMFATYVYPPSRENPNPIFLNRTTAVGSYQPNAWGVYDMHGNAWEWCSDWFDRQYYEKSPKQDPPGPQLPPDASDQQLAEFSRQIMQRVVRGGSWGSFPGMARSAQRKGMFPNETNSDVSFRVVLVPNESARAE